MRSRYLAVMDLQGLAERQRIVPTGEKAEDQWRSLLSALVDAQMDFLNAARRSLSRSQPALDRRLGGPLILEPAGGADRTE